MLRALLTVTASAGGLYALNKLYFCGAKCTLPGRLDGKLAVVTGANSGLGKETAAELARRGARVIMACRSEERAKIAKAEILEYYGEGQSTVLTRNVANASIKQYLSPVKPEQLIIEDLNLASFESIRAFAARICQSDMHIDFLINNAGVMACPYTETNEGFELQVGTNHLGHFLLTELLLPAIKRAGPGSRIICVSSRAHERGTINPNELNLRGSNYNRFTAYCRSKLANAIHAHQLAKRLQAEGILTASLHPGVVATELIKLPGPLLTLVRICLRPFEKNSWEGAQTTLHAILANDLQSGAYYSDCAVIAPNPLVLDEDLGSRLMEASKTAVGLV